MTNIINFKIPEDGQVVKSSWRDDVCASPDFELVGDGTEKGEIAYRPDATLVEKSKVEGATTAYKNRRIGHVALFSAAEDRTTA